MRRYVSFPFPSCGLRSRNLFFFYNTAWPHYKLPNGETWPINVSINYNSILQLDLYCKHQGKWSETPHVQAFFLLLENDFLLQKGRLNYLSLTLY